MTLESPIDEAVWNRITAVWLSVSVVYKGFLEHSYVQDSLYPISYRVTEIA